MNVHALREYWDLEIELCRIAGDLAMSKAQLLASAKTLPRSVFLTVERILWRQVDCLERNERPNLYLVKA